MGELAARAGRIRQKRPFPSHCLHLVQLPGTGSRQLHLEALAMGQGVEAVVLLPGPAGALGVAIMERQLSGVAPTPCPSWPHSSLARATAWWGRARPRQAAGAGPPSAGASQ